MILLLLPLLLSSSLLNFRPQVCTAQRIMNEMLAPSISLNHKFRRKASNEPHYVSVQAGGSVSSTNPHPKGNYVLEPQCDTREAVRPVSSRQHKSSDQDSRN